MGGEISRILAATADGSEHLGVGSLRSRKRKSELKDLGYHAIFCAHMIKYENPLIHRVGGYKAGERPD